MTRTAEETDDLLDLLNEARRQRDEALAQRDKWMEASRASGAKMLSIKSHAGDRNEKIQDLRDELADALDRAKRAETEVQEWQKTLGICRDAAAKGAARVRERHASALGEARAELEQVRATLAPLWPGGDVDSATALAAATALALQGHRASEAERQEVAGLTADLVIFDETADFGFEEAAPAPAEHGLAFTFCYLLGVGVGSVALGVVSGATAAAALLGRLPW